MQRSTDSSAMDIKFSLFACGEGEEVMSSVVFCSLTYCATGVRWDVYPVPLYLYVSNRYVLLRLRSVFEGSRLETVILELPSRHAVMQLFVIALQSKSESISKFSSRD